MQILHHHLERPNATEAVAPLLNLNTFHGLYSPNSSSHVVAVLDVVKSERGVQRKNGSIRDTDGHVLAAGSAVVRYHGSLKTPSTKSLNPRLDRSSFVTLSVRPTGAKSKAGGVSCFPMLVKPSTLMVQALMISACYE